MEKERCWKWQKKLLECSTIKGAKDIFIIAGKLAYKKFPDEKKMLKILADKNNSN